MKIRMTLLAGMVALLGQSLPAQYYIAYYGDGTQDVKLTGGMATTTLPRGNVMVGYSTDRLHVCYSNDLGDPYVNNPVLNFNKYFQLFHSAGNPYQVTSAQVVEANAGEIAVIGSYKRVSPADEGFYFIKLDQDGSVIFQQRYPWSTSGVSSMSVNGITKNGSDIYVTGKCKWVSAGLMQTYPIAAKFSTAGVAQWARIYPVTSALTGHNVIGADLEYVGGAGAGGLQIVGMFMNSAAATSDAMIFRVDPANGNYISGGIYGDAGSIYNDSFSGLCFSSSLNGGGTGLMVCGQSNSRGAGNYDTWAIKVSTAGTVMQTKLLDYDVANQNNYCNDVVERYSTVYGYYTYFFTGWVNGGTYGLDDMNVLKVHQSLNPIPLGSFTYGTSSNNERAEMAAFDLGTPDPGIYFFGYGAYPFLNNDMMGVKAFHDGKTCDYKLGNFLDYTGPGLLRDLICSQTNSVTAVSMPVENYGNAFSYLCTKKALSVGGNNNKMSEAGDAATEIGVISITSLAGVSDLSAVMINAPEATAATVEVFDLRGVLLHSDEMNLAPGANRLPAKGDVAPGIVVVRVTAEDGKTYSGKVLIQ